MKLAVISPIKSGGKRYEIGDQIDLTKAQADDLPPGLVKPLAAEEPPTAGGETKPAKGGK